MRPVPAACTEGSCAGGGYPAFSFVRLSSPETASILSNPSSVGLGLAARSKGPHSGSRGLTRARLESFLGGTPIEVAICKAV